MTRLALPQCEIKCGINMYTAFDNWKSLMSIMRGFTEVIAVKELILVLALTLILMLKVFIGLF